MYNGNKKGEKKGRGINKMYNPSIKVVVRRRRRRRRRDCLHPLTFSPHPHCPRPY
jgi:hypothetical protein